MNSLNGNVLFYILKHCIVKVWISTIVFEKSSVFILHNIVQIISLLFFFKFNTKKFSDGIDFVNY